MTRLSVIFHIFKQRAFNIFLVSVMFASLLIIFMVGLSVKDIFYSYMQSSYGNVPDLKVKLNIDNKKVKSLIKDIKDNFTNEKINILSGYEFLDYVSIVDSEERVLAKKLPLFMKFINVDDKIDMLIDNKKVKLKVKKISYVDEFYIELNLSNLKVKDKNSIKFLNNDKIIKYEFCKKVDIIGDSLKILAVPCKDEADKLLDSLEKNKAKKIKIEVDGKVFSTDIIEIDKYYKSLIVKAKGLNTAKRVSLAYNNIEIDNSKVQSCELDDDELIIDFYQDANMEKNFKIFLSNILQNFINYKRLVLKVKYYSFENDDKSDKEDKYLVYLNELTDLIDLIFAKDMGNLAVSSSYLAGELSNFGILDNFIIKGKNYNFSVNIRSLIDYDPEKIYNKNILILNYNVLRNYFKKDNIINFIDIYSDFVYDESNLEKLKNIIKKYDSSYKIIKQGDIVPSIKPKKILFNTTVTIFALFILIILFIAMYIILLQFYSNLYMELALLKLYGSKITYQTFMNIVSFIISALFIFGFLLYEQDVLNQITLKYFFTSFEIDIKNYFISLAILLVYIVIIFVIEKTQIKKLNLIKGQ